jgi:hypothetical protein
MKILIWASFTHPQTSSVADFLFLICCNTLSHPYTFSHTSCTYQVYIESAIRNKGKISYMTPQTNGVIVSFLRAYGMAQGTCA